MHADLPVLGFPGAAFEEHQAPRGLCSRCGVDWLPVARSAAPALASAMSPGVLLG
jgi:hypothetical protein